jgi:hypothetical protein
MFQVWTNCARLFFYYMTTLLGTANRVSELGGVQNRIESPGWLSGSKNGQAVEQITEFLPFFGADLKK